MSNQQKCQIILEIAQGLEYIHSKGCIHRDIITYIVSTIYLAIVFFDKKIKLWEIIGFLVIYAIYVAVRAVA